jgi:deazaflavin-dependent oxidoreductase (nitroreductase family)
MLITVAGRRSGQLYTTPVNYVEDGATLIAISSPSRTWWKNLRGGAPVRVLLRGRRLAGTGRVIEEPEEGAHWLGRLTACAPQYARYLHVEPDASGQPAKPAVLARLAQNRVVVLISDLREQDR